MQPAKHTVAVQLTQAELDALEQIRHALRLPNRAAAIRAAAMLAAQGLAAGGQEPTLPLPVPAPAPPEGLRFVGGFTVDRDGHHPAPHSSGCSRGVFVVPAAAQDAQA